MRNFIHDTDNKSNSLEFESPREEGTVEVTTRRNSVLNKKNSLKQVNLLLRELESEN